VSSKRQRLVASVEVLDDRTLMSGFYTGPSAIRPIESTGGLYTFSISGPGLLNVHHAPHGQFSLSLLGTTANSTVTETLTLPRFHKTGATLPLASIKVVSGTIGSISLPDATLYGALSGSFTSLTLGGLSTNAQINVGGVVNKLAIGNMNLGPTGMVNIGGISQSLSVGTITLDGGKFQVGGDVAGPVSIGSISLSQGGLLSFARDITSTVTVAGNVDLTSNGAIIVGRNLAGLTIDGNFVVDPSGGEIAVGGTVSKLTINGTFQGKGTPNPDLLVGLDLDHFSVLGGVPGQGGLEHASIDVGKDLVGFQIARGIFNSLITVGVLIDGSGAPAGGNAGADGVDAIYNSTILAGQEINHVTINGNVDSTYVFKSNSTGYPTRIIAGEDRDGNFLSAGLIDNFQITGSLIDSVLAASVAPSGGNGQLPSFQYGVASPVRSTVPGDGGYNTYDAPFGIIYGGTVGSPIKYPNYTERSVYNELLLPGTFYNTAIDPTIDDFILSGAINPSFASPPLSQAALQNGTTTTSSSGSASSSSSSSSSSASSSGSQSTQDIKPSQQALPLPTKSTVLGGVISTTHSDNRDYAGIFAYDTRGVFIGPIPD
jgi:hypothetical protein